MSHKRILNESRVYCAILSKLPWRQMFEQKIVRNYVAICIFSRAGWSSSGLRTSPTVRWLVCVRPTCAWAATSSSAWWPTSSSPTTPPSPLRLAGCPSGPTPCTTGTVGVLHAYPLEYTAGIHYNSGPYSHQCFTYGKIILFVSGAEQALSNLYLASRLRRPYLVF